MADNPLAEFARLLRQIGELAEQADRNFWDWSDYRRKRAEEEIKALCDEAEDAWAQWQERLARQAARLKKGKQ